MRLCTLVYVCIQKLNIVPCKHLLYMLQRSSQESVSNVSKKQSQYNNYNMHSFPFIGFEAMCSLFVTTE